MMRLFARRRDSRPLSEPLLGLARSSDRRGRRARWRARPEAEALDPRLLMASANPSLTGATASSDLSSRVAQVLQPYLDQDQIPGITVSIVTDGRVALAQGYGVSNVKTRAPVEPNTRFDIGSVTKTFTAIGVMLLYQESQGTSHPLDLNAPISDYLKNTPSFKLPKKWAGVTTRELLNMSSGIGNGASNQPWQAQVKSIANHPLLFTPGTKTFYSDTNFDLLGELIEQRTGEKYGTFIHDQILEPLGMSETQELGRSASVPNQAVGYDSSTRGRWPKAAVQNGLEMYAAAGMVSTAQDMATYMTALLSGRLLDPATYSLMWDSTPTPQYGVNPPTDSIRGLGWDMAFDTSQGTTEVIKGGSVPGFISEIILYPGSDSGVFVSINTNPQGSRAANRVSAVQVAESVYAATQTGSLTGG
jgi:CubicO group peptidase (beta-lactamase class C family)